MPRAACDAAVLRATGFDKIEVFAWDAETATAHARMFAPAIGVPEDPATGSAALGLGGWLVASGLLGAKDDRRLYDNMTLFVITEAGLAVLEAGCRS